MFGHRSGGLAEIPYMLSASLRPRWFVSSLKHFNKGFRGHAGRYYRMETNRVNPRIRHPFDTLAFGATVVLGASPVSIRIGAVGHAWHSQICVHHCRTSLSPQLRNFAYPRRRGGGEPVDRPAGKRLEVTARRRLAKNDLKPSRKEMWKERTMSSGPMSPAPLRSPPS